MLKRKFSRLPRFGEFAGRRRIRPLRPTPRRRAARVSRRPEGATKAGQTPPIGLFPPEARPQRCRSARYSALPGCGAPTADLFRRGIELRQIDALLLLVFHQFEPFLQVLDPPQQGGHQLQRFVHRLEPRHLGVAQLTLQGRKQQ